MFRLDLKDCCTCVPPRGQGPGARGQGPGEQGPAGQGARGQDMTFGLLHGSKTNARENFLFNGLFKTPKFDLQEKLPAKKISDPEQYR